MPFQGSLTFLFRVRELDGREFRVGLLLLPDRDVRRDVESLKCPLDKWIADAVHGGVNKPQSRRVGQVSTGSIRSSSRKRRSQLTVGGPRISRRQSKHPSVLGFDRHRVRTRIEG
jgi:hypothetical protein